MGRKNFVYENLLKEYTTLRSAELDKTAKAKARIEEANTKIEKNKKLMVKATESGDIDAYAELTAENAKNAEIVKFFNGVLEATKQNTSITPEQANELYKKANDEMAAIKEEYNKDLIEALKPLIEISNKAYMQLYLLAMAKNKIKNNLEHKKDTFFPPNFFDLSLMAKLDQILQDRDYKTNNPEFEGAQKFDATHNNWRASADNVVNKEKAKWI